MTSNQTEPVIRVYLFVCFFIRLLVSLLFKDWMHVMGERNNSMPSSRHCDQTNWHSANASHSVANKARHGWSVMLFHIQPATHRHIPAFKCIHIFNINYLDV